MPALLKYFLKVHRSPAAQATTGQCNRVREAIRSGDTAWVMDKHLLATVIREPVERTAALV
ncbi:hypothetical protein GCM10009602_11940 [Nocardiopsis tropica]